ncbi:hypothetical protein [Pseudoroseicyclus sp. CXY001]|uniref:hypothetical protein n=1 Tax=Pseudoroseicyclus sp. CXY001 TaxID=3242492 RepID=UPI0035712498
MWSQHDEPTEIDIGALEVQEVLYYYDEPLIYTTTLGVENYIVVKFDEVNGRDYFFCSELGRKALDCLKEGSLSVRGSLGQGSIFIFEMEQRQTVSRLWKTKVWEIDESLLPERGVGLDHQRDWAADFVEQADAFFSARFSGGDLGENLISLKNLRDLTSGFYDAVRKLFHVNELFGNSGILQFPLYEPQLGSLVLSIKEPMIDEALARQASRHRSLNQFDVLSKLALDRDGIFDLLASLKERSSHDEMEAGSKLDILDAYENLGAMLPTMRSSFSELEVTHSGIHSHKHVRLSRHDGAAIIESARKILREPISLTGEISIINSKSRTFVIDDAHGRQTTAEVPAPLFDALLGSADFKNGARVQVRGGFKRRRYRDLVSVEQVDLL